MPAALKAKRLAYVIGKRVAHQFGIKRLLDIDASLVYEPRLN
jgi:hypothetical protein